MEEEKTVTLLKPIVIGAEQTKELRLREPTAGEFARASAEANPMDADIMLVSLVSGVPVPIVRRLGIRDFNAAAEYLRGFIIAGPTTGDGS